MIKFVNASKGEVILYDPDLEAVKTWDLQSLLCLEHNASDGLVASLEGVRHGVLVAVPVSLMEKVGTYYFVLRVWDNHAHLHKDHQVKLALEMNAGYKTPKLRLTWAAMRPGQELRYGTIDPNSGVKTDRIFPDLPEPPERFTDSERQAYRRVKVKVFVYDEPEANRTVYPRLLDPDDPSAPDTPEEDKVDNNDRDAMGNLYPRGEDNRTQGFVPKEGRFIRVLSDGTEEILGRDTEVTTNENGYAEAIVELSVQPGNNFKVAGAFDASVRDQMHIGEGTQEAALRVYVGNQKVPEGNEPDITPVARATPLLTVWRRLWVERDRMGLAPAETKYGDDDKPLDNFGMPLDALTQAMREAYVEVKEHKWNSNSWTWWKYNFVINDNLDETDDEDWHYCITGLQNHPPTRDSRGQEKHYFWCVYVVGVYELGRGAGLGEGNDGDPIPNDLDNDPDTEGNDPNLPEDRIPADGYTLRTEPEASLISREQMRDICAEFNYNLNELWVKAIGHEIGHQFELSHNKIPGNLMGPSKDAKPRWLPKDIDQIRKALWP